eukprot:gene18561-24284_t
MVKVTKVREDKPKVVRNKTPDIVTRDYTIHLNKRLFGVTFKNRAPRAIREIKLFARKAYKTIDVRIDPGLNKYVWSRGIKNLPKKIRLRLSRRRNEDEEAKEKLYTIVSHVPVTDFKGLETENVDE